MIRTLALASALLLACPLLVAAGPADTAKAQPLVGTWQGMLGNGMGGQIRVVLKVAQSPDGALTATMDSPDQNASGIPVAKITFEQPKLTLDVTAVAGSYEGTLDPRKNEISGTWRQSGQELPLLLKKDVPAKDAPSK